MDIFTLIARMRQDGQPEECRSHEVEPWVGAIRSRRGHHERSGVQLEQAPEQLARPAGRNPHDVHLDLELQLVGLRVRPLVRPLR